MRFISAWLFCLTFAIPAGAGPGITNRVLPASIGAWSSSQTQQVRPESLDSFSADDAPVLREYGILGAERAVYENGGQQLVVTLYRMRDSSAAYGAYTFLRTADMAPFGLAEHSAASRERVLAVVGNLLLDLTGPATASLSDLKSLAASISHAAEMAAYPIIGEYLPAQGLIANSDHYLLGPAAVERLLPGNPSTNAAPEAGKPIADFPRGDWLGFADGAEAELARYRLRGEVVTLLLVRYPTRQIATKHLDALGRLFNVNPADDPTPIATGPHPAIFVVRKSGLLAIVFGTASRALASELIRGVQYETHLTWNEPGWRVTEKPFAQLLYEVFVGTGVILMYAIVASLAFGLFRLTVKRLLPNRVFDRPNQMEVLQLGIYSKPIEAKDFYSDEPPK